MFLNLNLPEDEVMARRMVAKSLICAFLMGYFGNRSSVRPVKECYQIAEGQREYTLSTFYGTNSETVTLERIETPWGMAWAGRSWQTDMVLYWIEA